MSNVSPTSHSEAIAGVRIKRFLTMAVLKFSKELLNNSRKREDTKNFIESTITDLVKSSFTLSTSDNPVSQAKLFVASLGFSPCEIEWAEDVRLGKFLLGKSRLWKATSERDTELINLLILAIVKGLGYSFVEGNVEVSFVDGVLPPRFSYEVQFRTAEQQKYGLQNQPGQWRLSCRTYCPFRFLLIGVNLTECEGVDNLIAQFMWKRLCRSRCL